MDGIYTQWPRWIQQEFLNRLSMKNWSELSQLKDSKTHYWNKILQQYELGIPLTRILGYKYFYDYKIINHNVLDPRYDSEVIMDVLNHLKSIHYKPVNAIELGAGSGCLSITTSKYFNIPMDMVELNQHSIKTLKRNIKKYGIIGNIIHSNWWDNVTLKYDILVCNPPYLSLNDMINGSTMSTYDDPSMALYGGVYGLQDYKIILSRVKNFINHWIILEICSRKLEPLLDIIQEYGLITNKIFYDLNNQPRMLLIMIY